jgi:beta-lactamase regulating signal transducer with metallopeptidase domain
MVTMNATVNRWAETWLNTMTAVLWQSVLLAVLAILLAWCLRRSSPVVRYWLWQIVAIKLLLMPIWTYAVPLPSWAEIRPHYQLAAVQSNENLREGSGRLEFRQPSLLPASQSPSVNRVPLIWETIGGISWKAWLLTAWFVGVVVQIVRLLVQRFRLEKLINQAVPASGEIADLVAELAGQIGVRCAPVAVSVAGDNALFVCGIRTPRLVVPGRLLDALNPAERRQVVLHELGHIKRHDLLWGWPVEIARIIYFFNPLVYWVAYGLRLERELACDQLAMAYSGHAPSEYAGTLIRVISHASEPASSQAAAIAAGLTGSEGKRIKDEGWSMNNIFLDFRFWISTRNDEIKDK